MIMEQTVKTMAAALRAALLPELTALQDGQRQLQDGQRQLKDELSLFRAESAARMELLERKLDMLREEHARRMDALQVLIETNRAEHARRLDTIEARLEILAQKAERQSEQLSELRQSVNALGLLGDYVRKIDEVKVDLRQHHRRIDALERRTPAEPAPRLPKAAKR